jgi:hypothetical protein
MDRRTFLKTASIGISGAIPAGRKQSSNLVLLKAKSVLLGRFSTAANIRALQGSEQALLNELRHINLEAFTHGLFAGIPGTNLEWPMRSTFTIQKEFDLCHFKSILHILCICPFSTK